MIRALALSLSLILPLQAAWALAPEISIRPTARPATQLQVQTTRIRVFFNPDFRPTPRPGSGRRSAVAERTIFFVPVHRGSGGFQPKARPGRTFASSGTVRVMPVSVGPSVTRPTARPYPTRQATITPASAVITQPQVVVRGKSGKICGKSSIRGEKLSRISGNIRGCGIAKPVRVSEVAGVPLSQPAIMDCDTAKALDRWVDKGVKPTIGRLGGGLRQLNVIAGYSCRTRNSQPGAEISEHGKGKAVDISGFTLANGKTVSVLSGWDNRGERRLLERLHKAACGPFGTVLGPKSDRYHKDHFHLDTARHRGGTYCR